MKVHNLARGFWDHEAPSSTLAVAATGCKRLRPLASSKLPSSTTTTTSSAEDDSCNGVCPFDLKSFIRPESIARKLSFSDAKIDATQVKVETHPGGTRWNPTQEQIGILEMMYRGGMRTPNAQQIEQITEQLGKYGRIEGKNVFYWFQNHKARERQKQKRSSLGLGRLTISPSLPRTLTTTTNNPSSSSSTSAVQTLFDFDFRGAIERIEDFSHKSRNDPHFSPQKRKCGNWGFRCVVEDSNNVSHKNYDEDEQDVTLVLFPLHPEGK